MKTRDIKPEEVTSSPTSVGMWNTDELTHPKKYGGDKSYQKAAGFLVAPYIENYVVEDWGCGGQQFKMHVMMPCQYVGVDGSPDRNPDVVDDVATRETTAQAILIRHVLEHNNAWKDIMRNALDNPFERLCIILFIPLGKETKLVNKEADIPFWQFAEDEFRAVLAEYDNIEIKEEKVKTPKGFKEDHILYITKKK